MHLNDWARSFQGKAVELNHSGIGVCTWVDGEFTVLRRTAAGDRGKIIRVADAGFNGLLFRVRLANGEEINAYEADVRVVTR